MDKTTPTPESKVDPDLPIQIAEFADPPKKRGGVLNILTMQAIVCTVVLIAAVLLGTFAPSLLESCRRKYQTLVTADTTALVGAFSDTYKQVFGTTEQKALTASDVSADNPSSSDSEAASSTASDTASAASVPTASLPTIDGTTPTAGVLNLLSAPAGTSLLPVKATLSFTPPLKNGQISSFYGQRISPITGKREFHKALDLAADKGTAVYAVADGTVTTAARSNTLGKYIRLSHADGFSSKYGHLSSMAVKAGQTVKAGDLIGRVGSTGQSTGNHLHFEIQKNEINFNPLYIFSYA